MYSLGTVGPDTPTSLQTYLDLIVDQLLELFEPGIKVIDASFPAGHSQREFILNAILLATISD